jgi:hypothetical protein
MSRPDEVWVNESFLIFVVDGGEQPLYPYNRDPPVPIRYEAEWVIDLSWVQTSVVHPVA